MKNYLLLVLITIPLAAFAQDEPARTAHTQDYIDMAVNLLAIFGAGGWAAAFVPAKVRNSVPILKMVINFLGTNFLNTKNKDD